MTENESRRTRVDDLEGVPLSEAVERLSELARRESAHHAADVSTRDNHTPLRPDVSTSENHTPLRPDVSTRDNHAPLTVGERLELHAAGAALARHVRHPSRVEATLRAGASWSDLASALGTGEDELRTEHRSWTEGRREPR